MSDRARNYVKSLPAHRVRGATRHFLFYLADYHNVHNPNAPWPSLETLAEDMGRDLRWTRRLVKQCIELALIDYVPGGGRGKTGKFTFLDLQEAALSCAEKEGQKEGEKGGQIEGQIDSLIRNEPEPDPKQNHHASGAVKFWLEFKQELKTVLGVEEWEASIRPIYFLKALDHKHLLLAAPPNTKIINAYKKREPLLRQMLRERGGYCCSLTKYPEVWELGTSGATKPGVGGSSTSATPQETAESDCLSHHNRANVAV